MTKYIEVINNNNKVSIDDTTQRLCKTRTLPLSGTPVTVEWSITPSDWGISNEQAIGAMLRYTVSLNANEKLVAIRALHPHDNVAFFAKISGSSVYIYAMSNLSDRNIYVNDYLIDVYGTTPQQGTGTVGLEVFNASGEKIFDSNYYYLDVKNFIQIDHLEITGYTWEQALVDYLLPGTVPLYFYSDTAVIISGSMFTFNVIGYPNYVTVYGSGIIFGSSRIKLDLRIGMTGQGSNQPTLTSDTRNPSGVCYQTNALFIDATNIS